MKTYQFTEQELEALSRLSYLHQQLKKGGITWEEDEERENIIEVFDYLLPLV